MFDLNGIPQEHFLPTFAPFSIEFLQEFMPHREERVAVIDYQQSVLRGQKFITYVGNINIQSDVLFPQGVSKEDKFEVIRAYMESKVLVGCPSLAITVACILTAFKGINEFYINVGNPVLTAPEIVEFIEQNSILVNKWVLFFDSTLLFCLSTNWKFIESMGHPEEHFRCVDDAHFIGNNYSQLFNVPGFMSFYFTEPVDGMVWFTKQFDMDNYDLAFQNIFGYYMSAENPLPAVVEVMGSEDMSFAEFLKSAQSYVGLVDKANNG